MAIGCRRGLPGSAVRRVLVVATSAIVLGAPAATIAPVATPPASAGLPYFQVAKAALDSMVASANSYECSKAPDTTKCQMGGLGDVLRFFGTVEQRQQAQILQTLADIKVKLEAIQRDISTIRQLVNQIQFNGLLGDLHAENILNVFRIFTQVSQNCLGKVPPYAPDTNCSTYLTGTNPANTKLANDIHTLVVHTVSGLNQVRNTVEGQPGKEGLLQVLPRVVTDLTDKTHFFTQAQSKIALDWVQYFVWAEVAFAILWQNDEEANHMPPAEVTAAVTSFKTMVNQQIERYQPLPAGTVVDMTTGLMWSLTNNCNTGSTTGPNCATASIGGFPLVAACQRFPNCTLPYPYTSTTVKGTVDDGILAVANTAASSSWKVPTEPQVTTLIQKRPNANSKSWLQQTAGITFYGDWVWTSTMWCTAWAQFRPGQASKRCTDGPKRVAYNLSNSTKTTVAPTTCSGKPCTAALLFERPVSSTEASSYLIDRRW